MNDNRGRILLLDVTINGMEYLWINLYNENTESEQLIILGSLLKIFQTICKNRLKMSNYQMPYQRTIPQYFVFF